MFFMSMISVYISVYLFKNITYMSSAKLFWGKPWFIICMSWFIKANRIIFFLPLVLLIMNFIFKYYSIKGQLADFSAYKWYLIESRFKKNINVYFMNPFCFNRLFAWRWKAHHSQKKRNYQMVKLIIQKTDVKNVMFNTNVTKT